MILDRFFIIVVIRVICILISCVVLGMLLPHLDKGYYYTLTGLFFLIVLQAWLLIGQANKTNTDLEKFFSSVEDQDSSVRFSENSMNKSFRKLHDGMNHINAIIQQVKIENSRTSQFLYNLVEHVETEILSFDGNGKVEIVNRAAVKYLQVHQPSQLSSIKKKNEELYTIIHAIRPGEEKLYKTTIDNLLHNILIRAAEFRFDGSIIKLVSFQDITHELDKKEVDSWQKLIRVLTHEIMNSISPITSLTTVISGYFKNKDNEDQVQPKKINQQIIDRTLFGLNTIEETSKGLLDFVDKYRSLASLPKPDVCKFTVNDLFQKCKLLMESAIPKNIKIIANVQPRDMSLIADYAQIEQTLINLIKNAIDAVSQVKNGIIQLRAFYDESGIAIQIEDNGEGISDDKLDDIFVPFYTTKENGSGIGLSLAKQIMQNHNGTISVNTIHGKGALFTLKFMQPNLAAS